MHMWHWFQFRRLLSGYMDMILSPATHRTLWNHTRQCEKCREDLALFEDLRSTMQETPAPPMPDDLAMKIRLRISRERARKIRLRRFAWRWVNDWSPFALPAFSGLLSALIIFGMFVPQISPPAPVISNDVPLALHTPPRLRVSGPIEPGANTENLVVQVLIDHQGRVADYDILVGTVNEQGIRELRNRLLFTYFQPAMVFGKPTSDTMILSFSSVIVPG